jgi:cystathionine beta-lyase/cystathionine gamma-synthase
MAAISTLFLTFCNPGCSFVYTTPLYGGTFHLIHEVLQPLGFHGVPVRAGDTDSMLDAIRHTRPLRVILIETPANPTLRMSDIAAAARAARDHPDHPLVAVDNTFLGPAFQHPLVLGADLSVYSATKYLAGYSDMLGGVVLGRDLRLIAELRGTRAILGNILQPDECWLLGSRLPLVTHRMNRQSKNAQRIAESLRNHAKVERLIYPSLFDDQNQIRIRDAQAKFPGGVFSIVVKGEKRGAFELLRNLKIFRNAVSLGGVESLACHPASTTHSEMSEQVLCENGISAGLVRFSTGVEDWRDLREDIHRALAAV